MKKTRLKMDGRYRTIHCSIWSDDKFPYVSDCAKLVFFHLKTTKYGSPYGLFYAGLAALAEESNIDFETYSKGFREGLAKGFFGFDEKRKVVFLTNHLA
jgi:hypothetical protein